MKKWWGNGSRNNGLTILGSVLLAILLAALPAYAEQQVSASSLPGGVTVIDSDINNEGLWGRAIGKEVTFSNFDLARFSQLHWGVTDAQGVGMAFDGEITTGTGEVLSYDAAASNLATGVAIWSGNSAIPTINGPLAVETRFMMAVSDGSSSPVSLLNVNLLPRVDVLGVAGTFTVLMKMQVFYNNTWQGALDVYDYLHTSGDEQVMTSLYSSFFVEFAQGQGMTLEEHDSNLQQRSFEILNRLDFFQNETLGHLEFLELETIGRLNSLSGSSSNIQGDLSLLNGSMAHVEGSLANLSNVTLDVQGRLDEVQNLLYELSACSGGGDIDARFEELVNILVQLWGIELDPNGQPYPETITLVRWLARQESVDEAIVLIQTLSDQVTALDARFEDVGATLVLEAMPSTIVSAGDKSLLVHTSLAGQQVDAIITAVDALSEEGSGGFASTPVNFLTTPVASGLQQLGLDPPNKLKASKIYLLKAEYQTPGGMTLYGSTLVMLN